MNPYSLDLRHKILRAYDQHFGSQRAIAALFGVSQSFVEKLLRRRRTGGAIAPRPHAGGPHPRWDAAALTRVRQGVREPPEASLAELCAPLHAQRRCRVSVPTLSRLLTRRGLPRKKSRFLPLNARPRASCTHARATGR